MHQLVADYLNNARKAEEKKKRAERANVLISLGLIDHYELDQFNQKRPVPVEVTDEEYAAILRYANNQKKPETSSELQIKESRPDRRRRILSEIDNKAERTLQAFNVAFLVIGIVAAAIILLAGFMSYGSTAKVYAIIISVGIILLFLYNWAILRTFINISNNLHQINAKLE